MLHPFFRDKLPQVDTLLRQHRVKRAYAFGSVCTEKFNDKSDIDLLISFEDGIDPLEYGELYWDLLFKLEALFGRSVDLMTERQLRNPYLIESINESRNIIYGQAA